MTTNDHQMKPHGNLAATDAPGEPLSERELADRLRRGSQDAAREFFDRYALRVYRFIFHALGRGAPADAEDLLQETFMALAEALPYFRGDCSLLTFACSIARRKVASFTRTSARRSRLLESDVSPTQPGADSSVTQVTAAMSAMSAQYREVLELKYVEELRVAEIASILGLTEHAVESRLARARRALGKRIGVSR